jgi:hypothetical protein
MDSERRLTAEGRLPASGEVEDRRPFLLAHRRDREPRLAQHIEGGEAWFGL